MNNNLLRIEINNEANGVVPPFKCVRMTRKKMRSCRIVTRKGELRMCTVIEIRFRMKMRKRIRQIES